MKNEKRSIPFLILVSIAAVLGMFTIVAAMMGVEQLQYSHSHPVDFKSVNDPALTPKVLLVGNSLLFHNELDKMATQIARDVDPAWKKSVFIRLAYPGQTLDNHYTFMQRVGSDLKELLSEERSGTWSYIVFQDQSGVMVREKDDPYRIKSFEIIDRFAGISESIKAKPMLFSHWAYSPNSDWPEGWDFEKMSKRIDEGYSAAAAASKRDVGVVHVGNAFLNFAKKDKERLAMLYASERKPSIAGTFLSACVLVATLTGKPVSPSMWMPDQGISKDGAAILRAIADEIVFPQDESK